MIKKVPKKVLQLIKDVAARQDISIYHVEMDGRALRIMIETRDGTTLDICSRFSQALSDEFDHHDVFAERYFLEVSSPGIERPLYQPRDFQDAVGQRVSIQTSEWEREGILESADNDKITLAYKMGRETTEVKIHYDNIKAARTRVVNSELFAAGKSLSSK